MARGNIPPKPVATSGGVLFQHVYSLTASEPSSKYLGTIRSREQSPDSGKGGLRKKLFFETRLSSDDTVSYATCHKPELAFTDGKSVSVGAQGRTGTRNAPTILNAMFHSSLFWDGRAKTLEDQVKLPLINPVEMGMESHEAVVEKVKQINEYPPLFEKAFGGAPTIDRLAQAIASFERTQVSGDAPFDRFIKGESSAISKSAQRGWIVSAGKAIVKVAIPLFRKIPPLRPNFNFFPFSNFKTSESEPEASRILIN